MPGLPAGDKIDGMSVFRKKKEQDAPYLAIDIGGTKILVALISHDGRLLARERFLTLAQQGAEAVFNRLFAAVDNMLQLNYLVPQQLGGIGIAAAGAVDSRRQVVTISPNLPDWSDVPVAQLLSERYGVNTYLVNDANAAALGEHRYGAGRGLKNLVLLTLGTGIGGGIIIDGQLYEGATGSAAELGHMVIDMNGPVCACGNRGCLEMMASGMSIAIDAMRRISRGGKSCLMEMVRGEIQGITAEMVASAARSGDILSLEVLSQAGIYLGVGLSNLVNIFNPELIIIGGAVAKTGNLLLDPAKREMAARAFPVSVGAVRITLAELGNDAGIFGAAAFAHEHQEGDGK
jgi:glucokinase